MPQYYPKSQVELNLYTNGKEYKVVSTDKEYIGYYYKTSRGKLFAGKNYQSLNQTEIIPFNPSKEDSKLPLIVEDQIYSLKEDFDIYITEDPTPQYPLGGPNLIPNNRLIDTYPDPNSTSPRSIPSPFSPKPTPKDIRIGEYRRYFAKKTNELIYIEISKETYTKFNTKDSKVAFDLYNVIFIPWDLERNNNSRLTNKNMVEIIERNNEWVGFSFYFRGNFGPPNY